MWNQIIYLTKDWYKKLQEELINLKWSKRLEIAEKLKEAISFWDLSENSEYEEARAEQSQLEKRILDLEEQLKFVEIIEETSNKENYVIIWAFVTIEDQDWEQKSYKIIWTTEVDILSDPPKISNESPVWKSLIWRKKWDLVEVKSPSWIQKYKIIDIK